MQGLDYAGIGNRIRRARKKMGWSQEMLAEKCGISLSFMGHIERGTRNMSLDTFANICDVLEADADDLLWGIPSAVRFSKEDIWEGTKQRKDEHYVMYAKIMKSVADIINDLEEYYDCFRRRDSIRQV